MSEAETDAGQVQPVGDAPGAGGAVPEAEPAGGHDDFWDRVKTDGDFALEQIRKRDNRASELGTRLKELEPVEQMVKLAGGTDQLFSLAQLGSQVNQNPDLRAVVQNALQTGQVPSAASQPSAGGAVEEEDEWIDPDTKKVRDTLRSEIDSLRAELSGLQQMTSAADVRSRESRIRENIEKALSEYEKVPEAFQEASEKINQQYQQLYRLAERGDPKATELVNQLSSEDGYSVLEYMLTPVLKKHASKLFAASETPGAEAAGGVGLKSTDERAVNPSRPAGQPLPPLPKGKVTDSAVKNIMAEIARRKGYQHLLS